MGAIGNPQKSKNILVILFGLAIILATVEAIYSIARIHELEDENNLNEQIIESQAIELDQSGKLLDHRTMEISELTKENDRLKKEQKKQKEQQKKQDKLINQLKTEIDKLKEKQAAQSVSKATKTTKANAATEATAVTNKAVEKEKPLVEKANVEIGQPKTQKTITVKATAYTAYCNGCSGVTKKGVNLRKNPQAKVIAVDPSVIPLGSKVKVEGYGYAVASDTGGAIKGNRIDVFIPDLQKAEKFGVRNQVKVEVIE